MIVIPSLDVRDGACCLEGGTVPATPLRRNDAGELLRSLIRFGFSRFHVSDLEPRAYRRSALTLTGEWYSEHAVQIQVSSDVQRRDQVDDFLSAGASFVVVCPLGADDVENCLAELSGEDSSRLIVAVNVSARRIQAPDAKAGMPRDAIDWVEELSHLGLGGVLVRALDERGHQTPYNSRYWKTWPRALPFPFSPQEFWNPSASWMRCRTEGWPESYSVNACTLDASILGSRPNSALSGGL